MLLHFSWAAALHACHALPLQVAAAYWDGVVQKLARQSPAPHLYFSSMPAWRALVQLSKKKMRSMVELERDVEASMPLADGYADVRTLPDSLPAGPFSKQQHAAGAAGATAATEKGLAGAAHATAEGAAQQQQQQQQQTDGTAAPALHPGLKSPPGASLQYRMTTRSMAARASGATSPTGPLPGTASRSSSRTLSSRQLGSARRRCLPLRMHLCTVVAAHLAVAALLGAGE